MRKKVKGIDTGFLYLKDNEGNIFKSSFSKDGITTGCTAFITINGTDYSVGVGNRIIDYDKSDSEMNMVTLITDLCMDGENEYFLGVGLPIDQFPKQKDKFKKQIMGYNDCKVIYQGTEMKIHISDVLVVPQGIGAFLSMDDKFDGDIILLDFGGMTIDVAYIEFVNGVPNVQSHDTYVSGIQKIYPKVINIINNECKTNHSAPMAEKFLKELDKGIYYNGEYKTADCLLPTFRTFLNEVLLDFDVKYPTKNTRIYTCGGSSIVFKTLLKERYPHSKPIPNSQFANAIGYYKAASHHFGSLIANQCYSTVRR
jgi:hypothetical protein